MSTHTNPNIPWIVQTIDGPVTSRRILSTTPTGRDVWVWRTDRDLPPLTFASAEDAEAWLAAVADGGTLKEQRELATYWHVATV